MRRYERVQELLPRIRERMKKADSFDVFMPIMLANSVQLTNGDVDAGRFVAAMVAPIVELMYGREWEPGMTTIPGELVFDPDNVHTFMYIGASKMTHSNPTDFPGAAGVLYWAIVPDMYEGHRAYPDVEEPIVAVRRDEIWWNIEKTATYRWDAVDNNAVVWPPGAEGVHQWVEWNDAEITEVVVK